MKRIDKFFRAIAVILLLVLLAAHWTVSAQDALPSRHILELQFTAAPTEPPSVEAAGETGVFKVNPVGKITGDLKGTLTERITQVDPVVNAPPNPVNSLIDITTFFTIKTDDGTIEGYFYGAFYFPEKANGDAIVRQHGQVLSVTAAYANLFLADVIYDGVVDFEEVNGAMVPLGDSGTLIIAPR